MAKYAAVSYEEPSPVWETGRTDKISKVHQWKKPLKLGCTAAILVFILNIGLFVWTQTRLEHRNTEGIVILYSGACEKTKSVAVWSYLAINILSSILLAASNVGMQCLVAPTREEIDKAHVRYRWLDVGVNTIRNVKSISGLRRILWILLALASVPLHLVYNPVIFEANVVNTYLVATTDASFANGGYWDSYRAGCFTGDAASNWVLNYLQENINTLTQLDLTACFNAYQNDYVSKWASLIIVCEDPPYKNESLLNAFEITYGSTSPTAWVCGQLSGSDNFCVKPSQVKNASYWFVTGSGNPGVDQTNPALIEWDGPSCSMRPNGTYSAKHCLAQPATEACQLGVLPSLLAVVLACNFLKIVCLLWTLWKLNHEPLVTLGDTIASFLTRPDPMTDKRGIMTAKLENWHSSMERPVKTVWKSRSTNGFGAASVTRWIICSSLFLLFWGLGVVLLVIGVITLGSDTYDFGGYTGSFSSMLSKGIGRSNSNFQVYLPTNGHKLTTVAIIVIANTPQLLVSLLYLLYNDLFTRMHMAMQWASYAQNRKTLWVLNPHKDQTHHATSGNPTSQRQRQYYILSLPLRISLPLLILMVLLHWLISQTIFLAVLGVKDWLDSGGEDPVNVFYSDMDLGWSPLGLILSLILGGLMLIGLWVYALMLRHGKVMPVVRTCSAAISAACHPPEGDFGAAERPVAYGAVETYGYRNDGRKIPGHACFTSLPAVVPLLDGETYI